MHDETRRKRRRSTTFGRAALLGAGATAGTIGLTSSAGAHYVYEYTNVISQPDWCMNIRSEVSHGSNDAGYYKGEVWMFRSSSTTDTPCAAPRTMPINWMRVQMWQWKAASASGGAGVCSATGQQVNNLSSTDYMSQAVNHGAATATCGEGWYENETRGWGIRNGNWETASLFSGRHCLHVSAGICQGGGK